MGRTYRAVNTVSVIKTSQLMLYSEIIAVFSQIHTKHINTLCRQNVEFLDAKPGGTYSNHWALKDQGKFKPCLRKISKLCPFVCSSQNMNV